MKERNCRASVFSSVLSRLNKNLKRRTLKPLAHHSSWTGPVTALRYRTDRAIALRQISVTALFYLGNSRKIHPPDVRACWAKDEKRRLWGRKRESERTRLGERERPGPLAPLFNMVFPPPGLPYVNWGSQECCLFYLRSSLRSSELPLFYFLRCFPSLSFSHHHFGLLFLILTT